MLTREAENHTWQWQQMALEVAASLLEERELPAMVFKGQHTVKAIYVREVRGSICVPGDRHSVLPRLVLAAAHCFCFLCLLLHSSWFSEYFKNVFPVEILQRWFVAVTKISGSVMFSLFYAFLDIIELVIFCRTRKTSAFWVWTMAWKCNNC